MTSNQRSAWHQSLQYLDLTSNHLIGKLPHSVGQIKGLLVLGLSSNSLFGPIPASVGNLSNLRALCLEGNMMNGKLPRSIGQLTSLETLYLLDNNWESTMTNIHFHNLSNIYIFSISSKINSFSFKVTQDCFTYFKHLYLVEVCGCRVGPTFPNWLRNLMFL